jgi:hypothetical protein
VALESRSGTRRSKLQRAPTRRRSFPGITARQFAPSKAMRLKKELNPRPEWRGNANINYLPKSPRFEPTTHYSTRLARVHQQSLPLRDHRRSQLLPHGSTASQVEERQSHPGEHAPIIERGRAFSPAPMIQLGQVHGAMHLVGGTRQRPEHPACGGEVGSNLLDFHRASQLALSRAGG